MVRSISEESERLRPKEGKGIFLHGVASCWTCMKAGCDHTGVVPGTMA